MLNLIKISPAVAENYRFVLPAVQAACWAASHILWALWIGLYAVVSVLSNGYRHQLSIFAAICCLVYTGVWRLFRRAVQALWHSSQEVMQSEESTEGNG